MAGRDVRAGSLFTGVGGLDLAIESFFGAEPAWMCEADPHCRTVLERHWPGVPIYPDVRELDGSTPRVDVLHGGYPCQPFSVAGKRQGEADPRHLWPEFARAVRLLRPRVVVLENVAGHLALGFDSVLGDLVEMGLSARWGVVRAADVGAPHRRARLFVVAHAAGCGRERWPLAGDAEDGEASERIEGEQAARDGAGAAADAGRERHDGRGGRDEGGAAGTRDGRAGTERHRAPAADADEHGLARLRRLDAERRDVDGRGSQDVAWGAYEPAIHQWERILGRPAPRPTDDRGRLMPEFVEWMMGFPVGWTDGTRRTHRLRTLGNAVVPQQGTLALRLLAGTDR